ncbi:MAG: hypothetical protein DRI37_09840 [Chloroflexi bacterium]|nr:MAG: hypothetical protein DRI37_09840 [Chloroflexota bacterium]
MDFSPQPFPFGQGCHNLQTVPQDHAVGPVGFVLVEFRLDALIRQAIEVGEQVQLLHPAGFILLTGLTDQIIYQDLGVDFLLDIQGRRLHH